MLHCVFSEDHSIGSQDSEENETYPRMSVVSQPLHAAPLADVPGAVRQQMRRLGLRGTLPRGSRVAIACGSRGIANVALITRTVVEEIRNLGWEPFLVPAMGSHGGATASGQVELLASYGLTAEYAGAPILSSMEVVRLGTTDDGVPVYLDRYASEAAGTVVINRVKRHTDFGGRYGSGLMKMLVAGLGNHAGAEAIHSFGARGLRDFMPAAARMVIERAPVLFGIALVDDGLERTSEIHAISGAEIERAEPQFLERANFLMASLPVDDIDLLLIDRMGKEISGIGMDTNIIGRIGIRGEPEFERPRIQWIAVFDLTEASHGNASGLGLADFTVARLTSKMKYDVWMANAITSGFPERGKIPLTLSTDRQAVDLALRLLGAKTHRTVRVVRIWDTLHLSAIQVSDAILPELTRLPGFVVRTEPEEISFLADGSLPPVAWEQYLG